MAFARIHYRWILAVGFGLILAADIYLYFQYQTEGSFDHMVVVTIINYAGLFIPYAMLVPLGMKHLPVRYMTTYIFIFLFCRFAQQITLCHRPARQNHRTSHARSHARHHGHHHLAARRNYSLCALFPVSS